MLQHKTNPKNLNPGLVASYDLRRGSILVSVLHKYVTY